MDTSSSQMPESSIEDLLDRYLADELSPAERASLEARIASSAELSARLSNPVVYAIPDHMANPVGIAEGWEQLEARVRAAQSSRRSLSNRRSSRGHSSTWWHRCGMPVGVAATLGALLLVFFLPGRMNTLSHDSETVRRFSTTPGQMATLQLANGAIATLGPATTLDITTRQNSNHITVSLSGQAQFAVTHSSDAAFIVRTGYSLTRVLGTTFSVRQYDTDRNARIVVVDGRVSVQSTHDSLPANQPTVLDGKTRGVVTDSGLVMVTPNVAVKAYTGWLNGELTFEDAPVRDIVADLARAYGVDLHVNDSVLAQRPITWNIQTKRYPLAEALSELTMLLNAHVQVSGRKMFILPGRRASQRTLPANSPLSMEFQYGK